MTSVCIACQEYKRKLNDTDRSSGVMEVVFHYFSYLSLLFGYSSMGLKVLLVIFITLTLSIPSKRPFLFLGTIGILFDVLLASLGAFTMARPGFDPNNSPLTTQDLWMSFIFWNSCSFIFVIFYVLIRLYIYLTMVETDPWDESSIFIRISYIIQYSFSCTIAPMIVLNSGILTIGGLFILLFNIITWPLEYLINRRQFRSNLTGFSTENSQ